MPKLTVKTFPVAGYAVIFRVSGRYGVLSEGWSPVVAYREHPFDYVVSLDPVLDSRGRLWTPEVHQERGVVERDETKTYRYLDSGFYGSME